MMWNKIGLKHYCENWEKVKSEGSCVGVNGNDAGRGSGKAPVKGGKELGNMAEK